jgi:hypothetical protein
VGGGRETARGGNKRQGGEGEKSISTIVLLHSTHYTIVLPLIILLYSLSGNTYQICPSFYHNINANLDNTVKSNPEQRN